MAAALLIAPCSSICCNCSSVRDVRVSTGSKTASAAGNLGTVFISGTPLLIQNSFYHRRNTICGSKSVSIRCEQSSKESSNGLDIWVGRLAMVSFAAAITVEIATGKGLLENIGLTSPLPTAALAGTALIGAVTAFSIFQSASKN